MRWTPERIRALRYHMRVRTQKEFAVELGLGRRGTVSELENGKRDVTPRIQKVLDLLAKMHDFEIAEENKGNKPDPHTIDMFEGEEDEEEESQLEAV